MKSSIFALVLSVISVNAFAGRYAGPHLVLVEGGLAHLGEKRTCEIYLNHPELKGLEITQLIAEAKKEPVHRALHVMAQVPSVEIYGVQVVDSNPGVNSAVHGEKVLLVEDYSQLKYREGSAASELVKIVNGICEADLNK